MADWQIDLVRNGYTVFQGMCPFPVFLDANRAIDHDLEHNYDPSRQAEYDSLSYCPDLRKSPAIQHLLTESGIRTPLNSLFGWRNLRHDDGQIAIRPTRTVYTHPPPAPIPHIDGIPHPHNGVTGPSLRTFTALVGVFLSDTTQDFAGNLSVWPGSHYTLQQHFRNTGRAAMRQGMPPLDLGPPKQLRVRTGDIILAHYMLAHAATINTTPHQRRAVFFRLKLRGLALRRWHALTNVWDRWRLLPDALEHAPHNTPTQSTPNQSTPNQSTPTQNTP